MEPTQALHRTVEALLAGLDFGGLWPGFHPFPFALRVGGLVCLDSRLHQADGRFLGNTAIPYRGGFLALWSLDDEAAPPDPARLAADLVHEMFHAFQLEQGRSGSRTTWRPWTTPWTLTISPKSWRKTDSWPDWGSPPRAHSWLPACQENFATPFDKKTWRGIIRMSSKLGNTGREARHGQR